MNTDPIKIEHGIPIPARANGYGTLSDIIRNMKIRDSFLYSALRRNNLGTIARRIHVKITTRVEGSDKVRVWRVK